MLAPPCTRAQSEPWDGCCHHEGMFRDRVDAGRRLGVALAALRLGDPVVLGIPRGGVIVAAGVARALGSPLDVLVTRKIGAPHNAELAIGAIAPGVQVWDRDLLNRLQVDPGYLRDAVASEEAESARRTAVYRRGRPPPDVSGRTVVIVDDGLATGATALAAVRWSRAAGAGRVLVAVPVAAPSTLALVANEADRAHAIDTPSSFHAVGEWYADFTQTTDDEVVAALDPGEGEG
jgi:putative phosphoribosyl transferase